MDRAPAHPHPADHGSRGAGLGRGFVTSQDQRAAVLFLCSRVSGKASGNSLPGPPVPLDRGPPRPHLKALRSRSATGTGLSEAGLRHIAICSEGIKRGETPSSAREAGPVRGS